MASSGIVWAIVTATMLSITMPAPGPRRAVRETR
jgi:hypothetical protein